jgi:creatinine amidohydrolase
MREVLWERLKRTDIEQAAKAGAVVIIPIASLEQHANHLPVNTDSNIVSTVARRAAQAVEFPVLVLPAVWTGYSPHHMRHPGSVTLTYHTFVEVLTQVAKSVHHHGFRKILLLNGHGGNTAVVAGMRTKLAEEDGVASVVGCDYWDVPGMQDAMRRLCPVDRGFVGHAGEFETSAQMYLQPDLVDAGRAAWAPGAFGDPSAGSEDKGKALIEAAVEGLVRLLQSYHSGELEDRFVWRKESPIK